VDRRPSYPDDFELILASQSPRRHSLLRDIGVPFRIALSTAQEELGGADARTLAAGNALAKVRGAVIPADASPGAFVLGTDTVVTVAGRVMGKASSSDEVADMLRALSGRTHQVVSGVALLRGIEDRLALLERSEPGPAYHVAGRLRVDCAITDVTFLPLGEAEIAAYVASGEWRGKAGAYAIQGLAGLLVSRVEGEYSNVVGLPLCLLAGMFRDLGFDILRRSGW
jgi:septum formation protein